MRRMLVMAIAAAGLSACGSVVFQDREPAAPVPMDVALERQEARQRAEAARLSRCQMGATGVERDDRECRKGL